MKNKLAFVAFSLVLAIAFFLRFYLLSSIPNGLQQDETSIGYNSLSILQTGKDEYGKSYPLYFKAFGEYKLPLSIYLTTISFFILGVSEFSLRFPSAIFGVLTVVCIYFLSYQLFQKRSIALLSMGVLALNPWHIHFSRGAFEVTPALFFITFGVYLYIAYLKKHSVILLSLGTVSLVVAMYGYNISRLFVPFLLILLLFIARKSIIKLPKNQLILPGLAMLLMLYSFVHPAISTGGYESTKGTLIFSSATVQAANLEMRSYIFEKSPFLSKAFFNGFFSDTVYYLKNAVSYFNAEFLFVKGSVHGNHGIGNVGQFYIFELIYIIWGVIFLIQAKFRWNILIFGWIIGVIAIASLTREAPHATRSFFLVVPIVILSAVGLDSFLARIKLIRKNYRLIIVMITSFFMIYFIAYYLLSYFFRFPINYAKNYRSEDSPLMQAVREKYDKYDAIYIDSKAELLYTSILFYSKFSPSEFHRTSVRYKDDSEGFSKVSSFGKYQYIDIEKIPLHKNSLVISNREINGFRLIQKFSYPIRPVVIANGQEIISFPVEDVAYVLLEAN